MSKRETYWIVQKDYSKDGFSDRLVDGWPFLYGTEQEAKTAMTRLEAGQDKSWFDPEGNEHAGYEAFLYVEQITNEEP